MGKFGPQRTPQERVRIQGEMRELLALGKSTGEIMKTLNLPYNTYYRYLDVIISEWKKSYARKAERIQYNTIDRMQKRMDEIMRLYNELGSDYYHDPDMLMKAQQIEKDIMACFESWGFVAKVPERFQVQHAVITWGTPDFMTHKKEVKPDAKQLEKPSNG